MIGRHVLDLFQRIANALARSVGVLHAFRHDQAGVVSEDREECRILAEHAFEFGIEPRGVAAGLFAEHAELRRQQQSVCDCLSSDRFVEGVCRRRLRYRQRNIDAELLELFKHQDAGASRALE